MKLPHDLIKLGFRLCSHEVGYLFAVSERWGCTSTRATLADVVREARSIAGYVQWRERQTAPPEPDKWQFPIGKNRPDDL